MVSIRLARFGTKKRPYYRIVVAEKSSSRDGKFIEAIGTSNPMAAGAESPLTLEMGRYEYWCGQGAQPSLCVKKLVRQFRRSNTAAA